MQRRVLMHLPDKYVKSGIPRPLRLSESVAAAPVSVRGSYIIRHHADFVFQVRTMLTPRGMFSFPYRYPRYGVRIFLSTV